MRRPLLLLGVAALLVVALSMLLAPAVAFGQEREPPAGRVVVEPKVGATLLGFEVPTGGLSAGAAVRLLYRLGEDVGVYAGLGADAVGVEGGWRHMGVTAGPRAGGWWRWGTFQLEGGLGAPYGQLTTCRPWARLYKQCARWWNLWGEASVRAVYLGDGFYAGLELHALYLNVPFGATGGGGASVVGSWR